MIMAENPFCIVFLPSLGWSPTNQAQLWRLSLFLMYRALQLAATSLCALNYSQRVNSNLAHLPSEISIHDFNFFTLSLYTPVSSPLPLPLPLPLPPTFVSLTPRHYQTPQSCVFKFCTINKVSRPKLLHEFDELFYLEFYAEIPTLMKMNSNINFPFETINKTQNKILHKLQIYHLYILERCLG
jgi:hypothetical protein